MKSAAAEAVVACQSLRGLQTVFLAGLRGETNAGMMESGAFLAPPQGSLAARWDVYREGYAVRLIEAIR